MLRYGTDRVAVLKALLRGEFTHILCGKLFRREVLQDFEYKNYESATNGEDGLLFYQVVRNCRNVIQIPDIVYNYYQTLGSSTQRRLNENGIHSVLLLNKERKK